MTGFFSKLFGTANKSKPKDEISVLLDSTASALLAKAGLDLVAKIESNSEEGRYSIQLSGSDESFLREKDGQVIDDFQLFFQRVLQHNFPDSRANLTVDCGGFREENLNALVELAEKLKQSALEKGKPVYIRALPPRDRKVIHQYLADDTRVKSRSIGDGVFKRIRIYPSRNSETEAVDAYED